VGQISIWPNVGDISVNDILRVIIEIAVRLDCGEPEQLAKNPVPRRDSPTMTFGQTIISADGIDALEKLVRWSSLFRREIPFLQISEFERKVPPDIQGAIKILQELHRGDLEQKPLRELISTLFSDMDEGDFEILDGRFLKETPDTLESVGGLLGVTRERIRQREPQVRRSIRELIERVQYERIRWTACELGAAIGSLAPLSHPEVSSKVASVTGLEIGSTEFMFICWVAGLTVNNGWLVNLSRFTSRAQAFGEIRSLFRESAEEHAIRPISDFDALLEELGIDPLFRREVVSESGWLAERAGHVAFWPNNACDKAFAILLIADEILTIDEILAGIDENYSLRSVSNRLHEDPRFVRANKYGWALSSWNVETYRNIVDSMKAEINRLGGSALLSDIVSVVAANAAVAESSVRSYADAPTFVQDGMQIRLRADNEPLIVDADISGFRNVWMSDDHTLRMAISFDGETLRGSGKSLPRGVTATLGVQPGEKREFSHEFGITKITWPMTGWQGGTLGSIRELLLESGVMLDERVVLVFDLLESRMWVESPE